MEDKPAIFGRGWAFPPAFDDEGVIMVQDLKDIRESLQILFSTQPGERLMRPDYGCDLQSSIFENISEALIAKLATQIEDSILRDETRIELTSVEIKRDVKERNYLQIQVRYRLRGSETPYQLSGQLNMLGGGSMVFK